MNWMFTTRSRSLGMLGMLGLLSLSVVALSGCGQGESASENTAETPAVTTVDHSHDGWWCVEHGIPEEECALCDTSLVSAFKESGDWCDEHARPESQCFICSPSRFDKFAAQYEAKTGRQPPKPTE